MPLSTSPTSSTNNPASRRSGWAYSRQIRAVAVSAPESPKGAKSTRALNSCEPVSLFNACRHAAYLAQIGGRTGGLGTHRPTLGRRPSTGPQGFCASLRWTSRSPRHGQRRGIQNLCLFQASYAGGVCAQPPCASRDIVPYPLGSRARLS